MACIISDNNWIVVRNIHTQHRIILPPKTVTNLPFKEEDLVIEPLNKGGHNYEINTRSATILRDK